MISGTVSVTSFISLYGSCIEIKKKKKNNSNLAPFDNKT